MDKEDGDVFGGSGYVGLVGGEGAFVAGGLAVPPEAGFAAVVEHF